MLLSDGIKDLERPWGGDGCEDDLGQQFCVSLTMFRIKFLSGSRRRIADKIVSRPKSEAALYEERGRCRFKKPISREMLGSRHGSKKRIFPVTRSDCITPLILFGFPEGSSFYERKKNNTRCCLLMGREPRTWRDLSNHHLGKAHCAAPREKQVPLALASPWPLDLQKHHLSF